MSGNPFHLGWFLSFRPPLFEPRSGAPWRSTDDAAFLNADFYIDMARSLQRACFDYMMFEDSLMVSDAYRGTSEADLKFGLFAPKGDPVAAVAAIAKATSHIGLIATASTSFYPPYMLARTMASLDHISDGRAGWNIVTSSEDRAAQNFGEDTITEHDLRYERADEFVEVVNHLWASWEPDALVMDRDRGIYVDHERVHRIDFEGKFFKSRGPLNILAPPQGRPVICQAGASPRGRDFAAKHAETIIAGSPGIANMRAFRTDIHERMRSHRRDPSECKILFLLSLTLGETKQEAEGAKLRKQSNVERNIEYTLAGLSALTEHDFSRFDLDAPLAQSMGTHGHQGMLNDFLKQAAGRTLREVVSTWTVSSLDLVGTPDSIASEMSEAMDEVGGDGFLIMGRPSRRSIAEVADGLIPELQDRGRTRRAYSHAQLRANLQEF